MDVFSTTASAVSVLAVLITVFSKLAAARVDRRRDHTIADLKWWATSQEGQTWIRGYTEEYADRHGGNGGKDSRDSRDSRENKEPKGNSHRRS